MRGESPSDGKGGLDGFQSSLAPHLARFALLARLLYNGYMPRHPQPRFPHQPLFDLIGADNQSHAARILKMSRRAFYNKLDELGLK